MTPRPIFITAPARSGTSMIAGLLQRHGVWFGRSSKKSNLNPRGFFENDRFLHETRDTVGPQGPVPFRWWTEWPRMMAAEGWKPEQRWAVKAMPWAWKFLYQFEPVVVFCWRPATQTIRSQLAAGFQPDEETARRRVLSHWDMMRDIRSKADCVDVYTDQVARGRYASAIFAFQDIGITFQQSLADEWIAPKLFGDWRLDND